MKKLPIYISLLLLITCAKEDNPDTIDNSHQILLYLSIL